MCYKGGWFRAETRDEHTTHVATLAGQPLTVDSKQT